MSNANKVLTPYSIENLANARPLETYAVNRICQLEAQVANQESCIDQLQAALDQTSSDYHELKEILKPEISLTADGGIRKIDIDGALVEYCKYSQDKYYKLVSLLGLQKENYQACMQEYENEILYGIETDLSEDERNVVKADYEAKLKNEGADKDAN